MPDLSDRLLTEEEQINKFKSKGIKFDLYSEEDAKNYLASHNNYFKLKAYKQLFEKHVNGANKGKYISLDFKMLIDLARIDMHLRYTLIYLILDVEHFSKVSFIKMIMGKVDDYEIVSDFCKINSIAQDSIEKTRNSYYCDGIYKKYGNNFPVWAFLEIISFGSYVKFYEYCAKILNDKILKRNAHLLMSIRELRNACAHNNCIISNLNKTNSIFQLDNGARQEIQKIRLSNGSISKALRNEQLRAMTTLFYAHQKMVTSTNIISSRKKAVDDVCNRIHNYTKSYGKNEQLQMRFNFLREVAAYFFVDMKNVFG